MRILSTLLAAAVLTGSAASQQALNEQFNYSTTTTFPPTGWANVVNAGAVTLGWDEPTIQTTSNNWSTLNADAAGHDDYASGQFSDASLMTPTMNLSSYSTPQLTFDSDLVFAGWMLHNGNTTAAGVSTIEVSTDGGATWAIEWTETATLSGYTPGVVVDLASYAGQSAVDMQFHYVGTYAHAWAVDNVVVDNGGNPTGPGLAITGSCPGPGSIDCSGMTAGGLVYIGYSFSAGSFTVPTGPCAGAIVPVSVPTLLLAVAADAGGNVSVPGVMPASACGVITMAAFDTATCIASNTVAL